MTATLYFMGHEACSSDVPPFAFSPRFARSGALCIGSGDAIPAIPGFLDPRSRISEKRDRSRRSPSVRGGERRLRMEGWTRSRGARVIGAGKGEAPRFEGPAQITKETPMADGDGGLS